MPKHTVLSGLKADCVQDYKAVLCDLDGCLIAGGQALTGAADFVRKVAERLWIVSNNSSDTARTLAAKLELLGLGVTEDRILLAGEQAVDHLARSHPGLRLRCLADAPIRARAKASGLQLDCDRAECVLLGRMAAFDLAHLEEVVADLSAGACLLVTNTDRTHPGLTGFPVPETGAWLAAVKACLPGLSYTCFGKPEPRLLIEALQRSGTEPAEAVFVGDNPDTDGAAAEALGLDFIEIRRLPDTGVSRAHHAQAIMEGT